MRKRRKIQFFLDSKWSCRWTRGSGGSGCPIPIGMGDLGDLELYQGSAPVGIPTSMSLCLSFMCPELQNSPQKIPSSLSSHAEPNPAPPSRLFPVFPGAIWPWFIPVPRCLGRSSPPAPQLLLGPLPPSPRISRALPGLGGERSCGNGQGEAGETRAWRDGEERSTLVPLIPAFPWGKERSDVAVPPGCVTVLSRGQTPLAPG